MELPINSSLRLDFFAQGTTGTPFLTFATRFKGGALNYQTQSLPAITANGLTSSVIALTADELVYFSVSIDAAPVDGTVMCVVNLQTSISGAYVVQGTLASGSLYERPVLSWFEGQEEYDFKIKFPTAMTAQGSPGIGAGFNVTSTFSAIEIISLTFEYTASAAIANRGISAQYYTLALGAVSIVPLQTFVTAGQVIQVTFGQQLDWMTLGGLFQTAPLPSIVLQPTQRLTIAVDGIQAADEIKAINYAFRLLPVSASV